jgi:GTP-dependent phosphoenolpyruvate carboxykinase
VPILLRLHNLIGEVNWFARAREDKWVWKGSSSDFFSVKHAYEELIKLMLDNREA